MRTGAFLLVAIGMTVYAIGTPATGCGESYGNQEWHTPVLAGWEPIKDINDQHIQDLGSWAISEFLKHANCRLKFNKVVSGEQQMVTGMNYKLDIIASDISSGKPGNYKAFVYEQAGKIKTRYLISFSKAN